MEGQEELFLPEETTGVGATFSECGLYRYTLMRIWDSGRPCVVFLMLNPSTADAITNDPTVERCQRRAVRMGFGGLVVINLFAYRSTDPEALYGLDDPVGSDNDQAILQSASSAGMVICAWGTHGALHGRGAAVRALLRDAGVTLHYLHLNADGSPAHPLYLPYDLQPSEWTD